MADDLISEFRRRCYRRQKEYPPIVMRRRHQVGPRRATSVAIRICDKHRAWPASPSSLSSPASSPTTPAEASGPDTACWRVSSPASSSSCFRSLFSTKQSSEDNEAWSVLAQYVCRALVHNARMIWSGILDVAGLLPTEMNRPGSVGAGAPTVHDTSRLTAGGESRQR